MTQKQKAEELIKQFLPVARITVETGGEPVGREKFAKKCAII